MRVRRPPQVFDEQFEHAHDLNLRRMQWDDDAATQLARVVGSGALPNLRRLNVAWNQIGDKGAKKLADALEKVRHLPLFSPPPRRVSRRWFCPPSQAVISPSLRWFCPALPLVVIPLFPSLRLPAQVLPPLEKLEYRGNDQMGEPGLQALRRASCGL